MNSIRKLGKAFVKCQWGFLFVLPFIAADTGLYSENLINGKIYTSQNLNFLSKFHNPNLGFEHRSVRLKSLYNLTVLY